MTLLAVEGAQRRFAGREVVAGVSLAIAKGETVALMGPSGCGKTSLLQMIGLLDRPDGGTIQLGTLDAWAQSQAIRAELRLTSIGFVFQHSNLIPYLSARDNVALPAWRAGGARAPALARADELLERVGVGGRRDGRASELSIGEAQRVAVARALINRPRLVLADEPTGSLDAESTEAVLALLLANDGPAVLVVTHDPEVAARAGRTLHMRDGKLTS
ncbi:MAG: ABC transporter ATP-binding protein [Myxococcales bacterium]|nr:ABC transporter ATP-binding protein [Myxococcales bacterium]